MTRFAKACTVAVAVGVCLWFAADFLFEAPNRFATVPGTRDPGLVGTWTGSWDSVGKRTITFNENGLARTDRWGPITWGTKNGVLQMKFRSAGEGWNFETHPYALASGGKAVVFGGRSLVLTVRMSRD